MVIKEGTRDERRERRMSDSELPLVWQKEQNEARSPNGPVDCASSIGCFVRTCLQSPSDQELLFENEDFRLFGSIVRRASKQRNLFELSSHERL